jgi:hypothetical protein
MGSLFSLNDFWPVSEFRRFADYNQQQLSDVLFSTAYTFIFT